MSGSSSSAAQLRPIFSTSPASQTRLTALNEIISQVYRRRVATPTDTTDTESELDPIAQVLSSRHDIPVALTHDSDTEPRLYSLDSRLFLTRVGTELSILSAWLQSSPGDVLGWMDPPVSRATQLHSIATRIAKAAQEKAPRVASSGWTVVNPPSKPNIEVPFDESAFRLGLRNLTEIAREWTKEGSVMTKHLMRGTRKSNAEKREAIYREYVCKALTQSLRGVPGVADELVSSDSWKHIDGVYQELSRGLQQHAQEEEMPSAAGSQVGISVDPGRMGGYPEDNAQVLEGKPGHTAEAQTEFVLDLSRDIGDTEAPHPEPTAGEGANDEMPKDPPDLDTAVRHALATLSTELAVGGKVYNRLGNKPRISIEKQLHSLLVSCGEPPVYYMDEAYYPVSIDHCSTVATNLSHFTHSASHRGETEDEKACATLAEALRSIEGSSWLPETNQLASDLHERLIRLNKAGRGITEKVLAGLSSDNAIELE